MGKKPFRNKAIATFLGLGWEIILFTTMFCIPVSLLFAQQLNDTSDLSGLTITLLMLHTLKCLAFIWFAVYLRLFSKKKVNIINPFRYYVGAVPSICFITLVTMSAALSISILTI
ncbi:membrane hypothetical protein [Vibrio chagasii]|nr:membrane hypothetical protein [Vibrio chagasii]